MNWTSPSSPTHNCPYNHITCDTPIGQFLISWKGWKENPSYDVELDEGWIGSNSDSLEKAKEIAEEHIQFVHQQLSDLLNKTIL